MDRNEIIKIGGRVYPARYGVQAAKLIDEKFGGLEKMADALVKDGSIAEKMDALVFILEAVIRQGCAYKNLFEPDAPKIEGALTDQNGKYIPITKEELEIGISFDDFADLAAVVFGLVKKGNKQTVETEDDGKNMTAG